MDLIKKTLYLFRYDINIYCVRINKIQLKIVGLRYLLDSI